MSAMEAENSSDSSRQTVSRYSGGPRIALTSWMKKKPERQFLGCRNISYILKRRLELINRLEEENATYKEWNKRLFVAIVLMLTVITVM